MNDMQDRKQEILEDWIRDCVSYNYGQWLRSEHWRRVSDLEKQCFELFGEPGREMFNACGGREGSHEKLVSEMKNRFIRFKKLNTIAGLAEIIQGTNMHLQFRYLVSAVDNWRSDDGKLIQELLVELYGYHKQHPRGRMRTTFMRRWKDFKCDLKYMEIIERRYEGNNLRRVVEQRSSLRSEAGGGRRALL